MSSGRGSAGGGGRSKGARSSATGTSAAVAATLGASAAPTAVAQATTPAAAAAQQAAAAGLSAPPSGLSAAAQAKSLISDFIKVKRPTDAQSDAFESAYKKLEAQAYGEAKAKFLSKAPASAEARVEAAIDAVAKHEQSIRTSDVSRDLLPVAKVRDFASMPKADFDKAALALTQKERVTLHYHDAPQSLSPQKRAELVVGSGGTHYVGISRWHKG